MAPQLPHMPHQRRCRHIHSQRTAYTATQTRGHGLWFVAIQPFEAQYAVLKRYRPP